MSADVVPFTHRIQIALHTSMMEIMTDAGLVEEAVLCLIWPGGLFQLNTHTRDLVTSFLHRYIDTTQKFWLGVCPNCVFFFFFVI